LVGLLTPGKKRGLLNSLPSNNGRNQWLSGDLRFPLLSVDSSDYSGEDRFGIAPNSLFSTDWRIQRKPSKQSRRTPTPNARPWFYHCRKACQEGTEKNQKTEFCRTFRSVFRNRL